MLMALSIYNHKAVLFCYYLGTQKAQIHDKEKRISIGEMERPKSVALSTLVFFDKGQHLSHFHY